MKAVILAGGRGKRLGELTEQIPKPMVLLQGKPILEHVIDSFMVQGVTDFVICVGYRAEAVKEYFGDGSSFGATIEYIEEDSPLGTAGPIRRAQHLLQETFFVCNGDNLVHVGLREMLEYHRANNARATIALTAVENVSEYGVAEMDGRKIICFIEKPDPDDAPSNRISAGLYVMEPDVVPMIPMHRCSLEREIFPLLAEQFKLVGFCFEGQWFDTGTPERLEVAEREWDPRALR